MRARAEHPFGSIGQRLEELDQLTYFVFYAVAVHNLMKKKGYVNSFTHYLIYLREYDESTFLTYRITQNVTEKHPS